VEYDRLHTNFHEDKGLWCNEFDNSINDLDDHLGDPDQAMESAVNDYFSSDCVISADEDHPYFHKITGIFCSFEEPVVIEPYDDDYWWPQRREMTTPRNMWGWAPDYWGYEVPRVSSRVQPQTSVRI